MNPENVRCKKKYHDYLLFIFMKIHIIILNLNLSKLRLLRYDIRYQTLIKVQVQIHQTQTLYI